MKNLLRYTFLLCVYTIVSTVQAQGPDWTTYRMTYPYGVNIKRALQEPCTADQNQWIGNEWNYCYDGHLRKKTYYGIPNNDVRPLLETSNGDIYIGTYTHTLTKFDGTDWTNYNINNSGFPVNTHYIYSLLETSNGDIYTGTYNGGLTKFDGSNWTVYNTTNSGIPSNSVYSLLESVNGDIYVGTHYGLAKFDGSEWTVYNTTNSGIPYDYVYSLLETSNGDIYVGTGDGLAKFDGSEWTIYNTTNSGIPSKYVRSLLESVNGDIYVGTWGGGLAKFDGSEWTIYDRYNSGIPRNNVNSLLETRNGNIYVGTHGGLAKLDGSESTLDNTSYSGLLRYKVRSLLETANGDIYAGTEHAGLAKFDGTKWTAYNTTISGIPSNGYGYSPLSSNSGIPSNYVLSLLESVNGDIYIGTAGGGLAKFDGSEWTIYDTSNSGIPSDYVYSLLESANGDIYVRTYYGLAKFDGAEWTTYNISNSGIPYDYVRSLLETSNGDIYVGTRGGGLAKFDGSEWIIYNTSNSGIPSNYVYSLLETSYGDIYVGAYDGLAKFDGSEWTIYDTSSSGLPYYYVHSLKETSNGDIYAGTSRGLTKFDGSNWATYNIDNSPIPIDSVSSLMESSNGDLYIGTFLGGLAIQHLEGRMSEKNLHTITGTIYADENQNGIKDTDEIGLFNQSVLLLPDSIVGTTNTSGGFSFRVDPGEYQIQFLENELWELTTTDTFSVIVDTWSIDTLHFGLNPLTDSSLFTSHFTSARNRCGFQVPAYIDYRNKGTRREDITLSMALDESVEFVSTYPAPDSISADDTYHWNVAGFAPSAHKQIQLQLQMPEVDQMGEALVSHLHISNESGLVFSDTIIDTLTCAYDPNDKQAIPAGITAKNLSLKDQRFTYKVRFQNTGNDTAFTVVIRDTLSQHLDLSTFEVEGASHPLATTRTADGLVSFTFDDIMLPDSIVDEPNSHGYVSYSIEPKSGLADSTVLKNTAYIYFDFNPPIVTNTTFNTLVDMLPKELIPTATFNQHLEGSISILPNPFSEETRILFDNPTGSVFTLELRDLRGELVWSKQNITASEVTLQKGLLSSGIYILKLSAESGAMYTSQLMVE